MEEKNHMRNIFHCKILESYLTPEVYLFSKEKKIVKNWSIVHNYNNAFLNLTWFAQIESV